MPQVKEEPTDGSPAGGGGHGGSRSPRALALAQAVNCHCGLATRAVKATIRTSSPASANLERFKSVLVALELDVQRDLVAYRGDGVLHAEVAALELTDGIAAAAVLLGEGVLAALEALEGQRDRLGDAQQREVAFDRRRQLRAEVDLGRLERHGRELLRIEEVGRAQVVVARRRAVALDVVARRHRCSVDDQLGAAALGGAIEGELAGRLVEAAMHHRQAPVLDREARVSVRRIDGVGLDGGRGQQRHCGQRGQGKGRLQGLHHQGLLLGGSGTEREIENGGRFRPCPPCAWRATRRARRAPPPARS